MEDIFQFPYLFTANFNYTFISKDYIDKQILISCNIKNKI